MNNLKFTKKIGFNMLQDHSKTPCYKQQQGSSLLVSLILLSVIAIAALAVFSSTITNQKSASNNINKKLAFQATETQLYSVLTAPASEWYTYIPYSVGATSVVTMYKPTGTSPATPQTNMIMRTTAAGPVRIRDQSVGGSLDADWQITYETTADAQVGVSRAMHLMRMALILPGAGGTGNNNVTDL